MTEPSPAAPTPDPPASDGRNARFDAFLATLLGITAILTAVASYQGSLKDGDVIANYSAAQQSQADGNTNYLDGIATLSRDYGAFVQILKSTNDGDETTVKDLKDIVSDPFKKLIDGEISEDDFQPEEIALATKDFEKAQKAQAKAEKADKVGDDYNLVTVIAAVALFFLGIAGVTAARTVRYTMTAFGIAALTASLIFYAGAAG